MHAHVYGQLQVYIACAHIALHDIELYIYKHKILIMFQQDKSSIILIEFHSSLLVRVLQVFMQFLFVFQWCSKCERERCSCFISWVHLQEGPLVIVEGLDHFSETDTRVVVRVPVGGEEERSNRGSEENAMRGGIEQ